MARAKTAEYTFVCPDCEHTVHSHRFFINRECGNCGGELQQEGSQ